MNILLTYIMLIVVFLTVSQHPNHRDVEMCISFAVDMVLYLALI